MLVFLQNTLHYGKFCSKMKGNRSKGAFQQRRTLAKPNEAKVLMKMARDEALHGKALKGLLERYFGK